MNSEMKLKSVLLLEMLGFLLLSCLVAYYLCDVQSDIEYTWYSGIWHGIFLIPNFILSLFLDDIIVKANITTSGYTFFWWATIILYNSYLGKYFKILFTKF